MFSLLFLGTAACDYSPRLKTDCRDRFDRDARRSSSALLNGHLLIDCGDHLLDSLRIAGVDAAAVTDVLITHLHSDHYNPGHLAQLAAAKKEPLRVWVREGARLPEIPNTSVTYMRLGHTYPLGEGMQVCGLPANHDPDTCPQHLLFSLGDKRFFYALDGAWIQNETLNSLREAHLSLLVLDATVGDYEGDFRVAEHNSIPMIRLMLPSLRTVGMIDDRTQILLSHLAPSLHRPHAETEAIVAPLGLRVAYDGLTVEA